MKRSLNFHKKGKPGKFEICIKNIKSAKELSYAYTPGVAYVCKEISKDLNNVNKYTNKGNLVAVITNGTAVLGLGDIGVSASIPVMEGKSILFKKFAGINSIDIEINEKNPKKFCSIVKSLKFSFGGINLEDIKSPDCFYIEKKCKKNMDIPVFHDDQHGTAVVVAAALKNALIISKKRIENIKTVVYGAGAAAISCIKFLVKKGLNKNKIYMFDVNGALCKGRKDLNIYNELYARKKKFSKNDAFKKSDFFLGLSSGNILKSSYLKIMSKDPIVFALANPYPEINPYKAKKTRKDIILATGRSDYKNQVNNVLCFPYIFRAALDLNRKIDFEMKSVTSNAISKLGRKLNFSRNNIIPNIFCKKLISYVPYKIAKYYKKKLNLKLDLKKYKKKLKKIL